MLRVLLAATIASLSACQQTPDRQLAPTPGDLAPSELATGEPATGD